MSQTSTWIWSGVSDDVELRPACLSVYIWSRSQLFSYTGKILNFVAMPRCCNIICICEVVILPHLHYEDTQTKCRGQKGLTPINAYHRIQRSYSKLFLWRPSYRLIKVVWDAVTVHLLSTLAAPGTRVGAAKQLSHEWLASPSTEWLKGGLLSSTHDASLPLQVWSSI